MAAHMLRERGGMRALALALLMTLPAGLAHAEPAQEARSATAACLSAVIDNAPVEDIDGDDVSIRRGKDPVSCTVTVAAGEPVVVRDAVLSAVKKRSELFVPAKTLWDPAGYASRETFCNTGRRALAVLVSTAKPGGQPVLVATVAETVKRDDRCDRDLGPQSLAANSEVASPAVPAASALPPVTELAAPVARKRQSWLRRLPGLGGKD